MIHALIPAVGSLLTKVIDRVVPDKKQAAEMQLEAMKMVSEQGSKELQGAIDIIKAEVQSESWLASNWRPILMLVVVAIIGNNYLIAPYINALFGDGTVPNLDLPGRLWDLMTLGVGGYVAGRSGEKMVKAWKDDSGSR